MSVLLVISDVGEGLGTVFITDRLWEHRTIAPDSRDQFGCDKAANSPLHHGGASNKHELLNIHSTSLQHFQL